jgi:AraC-like DNA-binding protein
MQEGPSARPPVTRFSTEGLPPRDQFEGWRASVGVTHEMTNIGDLPRRGFVASADSWRLGQVVAAIRRFPSMTFERPARRVRADGLDHYSLLLIRDGVYDCDANGRAIRLSRGEAGLFDLARPETSRVGDNESLRLLVPRAQLDPLLRSRPSGLPLGGAPGRLLTGYLGLLAGSLDTLTAAEAPLVGTAARDMLAACLAATLGLDARAPAEAAAAPIRETRLVQVRRFIDHHLTDPALGPEMICRALGLSRSALYRLFESGSGVAAEIQLRRLARIRERLADPAEGARIGSLAYAHGFASEAHFSRAFRRAFGVAPREVRAMAAAPA